jgi:small subunit ribosomal protein S1
VLVNSGYKSDGLLTASEFKDLSEIHVGDEVEVLLERIEDETAWWC